VRAARTIAEADGPGSFKNALVVMASAPSG